MSLLLTRNQDVTWSHRVAAFLWLLLGNRYRSLKIGKTKAQLKKATILYRQKLDGLDSALGSMSYEALTLNNFLGEKHWKYASYMATISSLPVLDRVCNGDGITSAIVGKTSLGTSAKLLDNLNDEIQTIERAIQSLHTYERVMTEKEFNIEEGAPHYSRLSLAENSAFQIARWTAEVVMDVVDENSRTFGLYTSDVKRLVRGQIESLLHKSGRRVLPKIGEYLKAISEKSIGDVWVDVDLCLLESSLGGIDQDLYHALQLFRVGNGFVFKSSLVYDDAQDLMEDLQTNSVNSCVILGLERGVISEKDLAENSPEFIAKRLDQGKIVKETISLADFLFLTGIKLIQAASSKETELVDWSGLLLSYRFVRLFNLRKLLMRRKDYETTRMFMSSLKKFEDLQEDIPDHIYALQPHPAYDDA